MSLDELTSILIAKIQCKHLACTPDVATYLMKMIAPDVLKLIKDEVATDRRKREVSVQD